MLPRMSAPSYDAETMAAYFKPVQRETWEDPAVGPVLRRLAEEVPDVIAAVADVDRSQIQESLLQSPERRLSAALKMAAFVERTRKAMERAPG